MNRNNWVNYKEIKASVGIEKILEHYGLLGRLKKVGDNLVGTCPIHRGTNPTQFHVSLKKNCFKCFGDCHRGGNILDFVALMEEVDIRTAALLIQKWFVVGTGMPKVEQLQVEEEKLAKEQLIKEEEIDNLPLTFALKNIDPEHPCLKQRGLKRETIEYFGLGYCQKGLMAGRIVIPIHNEKGELVAYAGRFPGDPPEGEPKYKLPPGFKKSLVVFNLHRVKDLAKENGLVIVEGFFDCFKLFEAGFENVVALMGSSLSAQQERLIVDTVGSGGKVILMLDEDEAGRKGRDEILQRLAPQVFVKVIRLGKDGVQPDNLETQEIQMLLK